MGPEEPIPQQKDIQPRDTSPLKKLATPINGESVVREAMQPALQEASHYLEALSPIEAKMVQTSQRLVDEVEAHVTQGVLTPAEGFLLIRRYMSEAVLETRMDEKTGLPNGVGFRERLGTVVKVKERQPDLAVAVGMVDMKRFKYINDTLSHHAGDLLIFITGDMLDNAMRGYDTVAKEQADETPTDTNGKSGENDPTLTARKQGDEYLIMAPGAAADSLAARFRDPAFQEEYNRVAKARLLELIQHPKYAAMYPDPQAFQAALDEVTLGLRFGFTNLAVGEHDIDAIVKRADDDMNAQRQFEDPSTRSLR